MAYQRLNPRQLDVLQWIADGCPDGVMQDFTYKTTAVALRNRHLVTISKRGGVWRTAVTEAGRHYLQHGGYPEDATPARPASVANRRVTRSAAKPSSAPDESRAPAPPPAGASPPPPTQPPTPAAEAPRVPVPVQLRRPHPVVARLRDDKGRFGLTPLVRSRALRILQGLVMAAEGEGWSAKPVGSTRDGYGRVTWDSLSHLIIDTGECKVGVRMFQDTDRTPHVPTAYELAEQQRSRWPRQLPKYDHTPSDRLRLELDRHYTGRQCQWRDGKRGSLEEKLPAVLDEIAVRSEEAKQRRIVEEQRQAERERQWEAAMARAKVLLRESHRAKVLARQAANWRESKLLREYMDAMRPVIDDMPDAGQATAAREWLAWAEEYAERLDPLNSPLAMSPDPEPTPKALEPFLGGWSPYRPPRR